MATISINKLSIRARHGVLPQEQVVGNDFEIDITLEIPDDAGCDDDLDSTVDYCRVVKLAHNVMSEPSQLIEHVAFRLCRALHDNIGLAYGGTVTVHKLTPPIPGFNARSVSISRSWTRNR